MADRTYTYRVRLDTNELEQRATQIRALMLQLFNGGGQGDLLNQMRSQLAQQQEMARAAASADIEAQRQMTVIARAETAERSQLARAEAIERIESARQASSALAENERRNTVVIFEEERRRTALYRQELREREREQRQGELSRTGNGLGSALSRLDNLAGFATGGLAAFGTVQALQAAYRAANEGAQQLRFADVFENQAARVRVSANGMLRAIEEASNGTIRESQAMALGAQLLSQRFVSTNAEIAASLTEDVAVVTAFSRRAAQIYTDESGAALSTQEVYARLVKYVREGNKELVDQFGLSNQVIADALNIPIEGLAGPDGAAQRWRGLVTVLGQEMERLGTGSDTAADRMERASARIADATDRIKQALAPTTANIMESIASGIDTTRVAFGSNDSTAIRNVLDERIKNLQSVIETLKSGGSVTAGNIPVWGSDALKSFEEQAQRIQQLSALFDQLGTNPGLEQYRESIQSAAQELTRWGQISDETSMQLSVAAAAAAPYAHVIDVVGLNYFNSSQGAQELAARMADLNTQLQAGKIDATTYLAGAAAVREELQKYADAAFVATAKTQDMSDALRELVDQARAAGNGVLANIVLSKGTSAETFAADMSGLEQRLKNTDAMLAPLNEAKQRIAQELLSASLESVGTLGVEEAQRRLDFALNTLESRFSALSGKALSGQGVPGAFDLANMSQQLQSQLLSSFTGFEALNTEKERIRGDVQDAAMELVDAIGLQRATDLIMQQGYDLDAAFAALPEGLAGQELTTAVTKIREEILKPFEEIGAVEDVKNRIRGQLQDAAVSLVQDIGVDKATELLRQQQQELETQFGRLFEGMNPDDLALAAEDISNTVLAPIEKIKEDLKSNLSDIGVNDALSQITQGLGELNIGAYDFVPGIDAVRNGLYDLYDAILTTGQVTDEQAAQMAVLTEQAYTAGDSSWFLAEMTNALGESFFQENDAASGVLGQMIQLQGAYASGQISAEQHAGALGVLIQFLYDTAAAAGFTAAQLDAAFGSAQRFAAIDKARYGSTPGYESGTKLGSTLAGVTQSRADAASREQARRDALEAQREAERTAKKAASEYEQALKRGAKAVEDAAQEFQRKLDKIPGLMGTSSVTDQQMKLAAQGVPQNFADDWRRRLEDEVKNGKDWQGVSIEQAKEALQRVGVSLASSSEGILEQFNAAWADSSLFADKANLAMINQDAVKAQLDLQEKIKQGQQNIYDLFGATVDQVNEAVATGKLNLDGVTTVGGGKVAATIDGKPVDAQIEPKIQALAVSDKAIVQVRKDIEEQVKPTINFDTGTESLAKIAGALNGAISNDQTKAQFKGFGTDIANLVYEGFDGRTTEFSWLSGIASRIKYEVLEEIYGEDTK